MRHLPWLTAFLFLGCTPVAPPLNYDCPIINLPVDPLWPTKMLKKSSTADAVFKSYYADDVAAREWIKGVRAQVSAVNIANGLYLSPVVK